MIVDAEAEEAFVNKFLREKMDIVHGMRAEGKYPEEIHCVTRIAKQWKSRGKKIAVASSGDKAHVHADLKHHGLFDLFDTVVTREDVKHGIKEGNSGPSSDGHPPAGGGLVVVRVVLGLVI
eukprot:g12859.t1